MSATTTQPRITAPDRGEHLDIFGAAMIVKAVPARDGLFLAEHIVPPGYMVPPHFHTDDDEYFWILDGVLTLMDGAGETAARPGTCVSLPRGGVHGFRNDSAGDVRFLVMCRPGVQAMEMFCHFDRAGRDGALSPGQITEIAAQYGVTLLPPPA